jgi:hypothetical protein
MHRSFARAKSPHAQLDLIVGITGGQIGDLSLTARPDPN